MFHLLQIDKIQHHDCDGKILWEKHNIPNVFHNDGEYFMLQLAFNTSSGIVVPVNYYVGLDNRALLQQTDTLSTLSAEPTQNAYARQPVSSSNGFTVALDSTSNYRATSASIIIFNATGGPWGPVSNVFLTNVLSGTGYLISSVALDTPRTVSSGQFITLTVTMGLKNC